MNDSLRFFERYFTITDQRTNCVAEAVEFLNTKNYSV